MSNASTIPPFLRNDDDNSNRVERGICVHSMILLDGGFNVKRTKEGFGFICA